MGSKDSGDNTPEPTAQERALAKQGAQEWNRFATDIVPVADVVERNTKATDSDTATISRGLTSSALGGSAGQARKIMRSTPTSVGAAAMGLQSTSDQASAAIGAGSARGETKLLDRETRGLMSLAATGRGVKANATESLAQSGAEAMELANAKASNERAIQQGIVSGISSGVGIASGAGVFSGGGGTGGGS